MAAGLATGVIPGETAEAAEADATASAGGGTLAAEADAEGKVGALGFLFAQVAMGAAEVGAGAVEAV